MGDDDKEWQILELDSLDPSINRRTGQRVWMDGNVARDADGRAIAEREPDGRWNIMGSPCWGRLTPEKP